MKLSRVVAVFGLTFAASAQLAMAQPSVVVENAVVPVGTPTVDVDVTFTPDAGNTATAVFEVAFDDMDLSLTDISNCAPVAQFACSNPSAGVVRWAATPDFGGNLPGFTGTITFDLSMATVDQVYPLTVQNEDYLDPSAMPLPPMGTMDGSILVESVPAPIFSLTHDGGGAGNTIDFGVDTGVGAANLTVNATVENTGNDGMNNLAGDCELTGDAGGVFTIAPSNPVPFDLAPMGTENFSMNCMTDTPGTYMGELTCTHNAASSPDVFTLVCEEAPTPTYDSAPAPGNPLMNMSGTQGNGDVMSNELTIMNSGETDSLLTGTCSLMDGSTAISLPSGGFSVTAPGGSQAIGLVCDDAAAGTYNDTVSCLADPTATNPGPHTYAVECVIGPPDPGMFGSTPAPGGTIELTPAGPVVEGTDLTNAAQLAVRNTGDPGDEDIQYNCTISGDAQISQDPSPALGTLVAGGPDDIINYSCDTTANGNFTAMVECAWSAPLEGAGGVEMYTATCDVRDPFIDVVESPPSGTPQTADLMPNESTTFSFTFEEIIDEGGDGSVDCSLANNNEFAITAPGSFPQPVPSGGTLQVDVEFTDPGVGDTFTDTLNCQVTDNPDGGEPEVNPVSWPLTVNVTGRNVTFLVSKDFDDDNPAEVEVNLSCNTGLPLQQTTTISEGDPVNFVVKDFEPGTMDCDVSEVVPDGYAVTYFADVGEEGSAANWFADADGCHYEGLESADFICEITNELQPVTVTVNKEWVDDNPEYNLPTFVEVTLHCNAPIGIVFSGLDGNGYTAQRYIDPANPGIFSVFPHWDGSTECFVTEEVDAGVLPDVTDCESIPLAPGVDGECTIVNTRLYAGIPTLSQYGLILMALLMLGVGAVAFRRYA